MNYKMNKNSLPFDINFDTLSEVFAPVAQRIEQWFPKPRVAGSTPAWGTV